MNKYTWTDEELEAFRQRCDPLADGVIAEIYSHGSVRAVHDLLNTMVRSDVAPPDALPPAARAYFAESAALPDWFDGAAVRVGEQVFLRYGLESLASLLCASLPECYAMRNGVHVLAITQQLGKHTERRIYETAQMVVNVMSVGGLDPGGAGVRSAQKVRLMHAAMRYLLEVDPDGDDGARPDEAPSLASVMARKTWNPAWGRPINQADMAITLQSFSTVMLRSWKSLGVVLDPHEREGYYHCWRVVGHLLGLDPALNPPTIDGGEAVYRAVRAHQEGDTPEGRAMTKALADTIARVIDIPLVSDDAVTLLMRHLLTGDTATLVGVPAASTVGSYAMGGITVALRAASLLREGVGDEIPLVHGVTAWFGQRLLTRIARLDRGGERRLFNLPESLQDAWTRR
jgi:hypothetical protein